MTGSGKYDTGARLKRRTPLQRLAAWWRMNNSLAHAKCKEIAQQREAEYKEFLIWKGIVK